MPSEHTRPDAGRPWVSSRRAAQLLRKDPRTVRQLIKNLSLDGGCQTTGKRASWFVYTDVPPFASAPPPVQHSRLADENALLRARAEAAEDSNRLLLDTQATLLDALHEYQRGNNRLRQALDAQQAVLDLYNQAADSYRSSADSLTAAVGGLRDLAAAKAIPDDLSGLDHR